MGRLACERFSRSHQRESIVRIPAVLSAKCSIEEAGEVAQHLSVAIRSPKPHPRVHNFVHVPGGDLVRVTVREREERVLCSLSVPAQHGAPDSGIGRVDLSLKLSRHGLSLVWCTPGSCHTSGANAGELRGQGIDVRSYVTILSPPAFPVQTP